MDVEREGQHLEMSTRLQITLVNTVQYDTAKYENVIIEKVLLSFK